MGDWDSLRCILNILSQIGDNRDHFSQGLDGARLAGSYPPRWLLLNLADLVFLLVGIVMISLHVDRGNNFESHSKS